MSKAERIQNRERYYQRAKRWVEDFIPYLSADRKPVVIGQRLATRRPCSCLGCKRGKPIRAHIERELTADELRDENSRR